jgi:predicted DNA binding CopG/RHH family protein
MKNITKNNIKYTEPPVEVRDFFDYVEKNRVESLSCGDLKRLARLSPAELAQNRQKKRVSIMLNVQTVERLKKMAEENNTRYQTIIGDVLDNYARR